MLVSMAVTMIAVGSVFGFVGYRIFKGEGTIEKTADKLPRVFADPDRHDALAAARRARDPERGRQRPSVMTLEIDGKIEVRTFDVKTLTRPDGWISRRRLSLSRSTRSVIPPPSGEGQAEYAASFRAHSRAW